VSSSSIMRHIDIEEKVPGQPKNAEGDVNEKQKTTRTMHEFEEFVRT
jgi:hypothetical protein